MHPIRTVFTSLFSRGVALLMMLMLPLVGWGQVVISQVYGNGGNSGATYTKDYVEIFNRGGSTVDISAWTLKYGSATGTINISLATIPNSTSIASGKYYLVRVGGGSNGTTAVPSDLTGTGQDMSGSNAKVQLADASGNVIDLVGYGSTANLYEGSSPAPSSSTATIAVTRKNGGCQDTDDNAADFTASTANPHNSATAASPCTATLTLGTAALTGFTYAAGSGPSASQSVSLSGINLTGAPGNITVTGSTNYEVSADNSTFGNTATVPYSSATLSSTNVYVRLKAALAVGSYNNETISVAGGGATAVTTSASGTVTAPPPAITVASGTLALGTTTTGTPSAERSYTVSGINLTGDITVTAPAAYEISLTSNTYTGTGGNALTLTASGGTVASTTIYVRLTGANSGTFNNNITHTSPSATSVNKAVTGTVTNPTITLGTVTPMSYCVVGSATTITLPFTTNAAFPAGNIFSAQLSTAGGSFGTGAIPLGTVSLISTGTNAYTLTATIPANTANGTSYLVRIQASTPSGVNSGSKTITIVGSQSVLITPAAEQTISKNAGSATALSLSETPSADVASHQWAYSTTQGGPYTDINGATGATYTPTAAILGGATGSYYVVEKSTFTTCGTTTTSTNEVKINVVDTRIVVNPTSLSGFITPANTASAAQTYALQGYDLLANVTLTIPSGFEAAYSTSATPPTSYSAGTGSLTILKADALAGVTVYVRLRSAAAAGTYTGNINNTSSGAILQAVALTGTVTSLTASATALTALNTLAGTPSVSRSFTVTGSYLTDLVTVTAPAEYEVATAAAGPYSSSLTLTPSGATNIVSATINVRLTGNTAGTYAGNVVVSSPNAATSNVAVTGKVVGKPTGTPTITAGTPAYNSVTFTLGPVADGSNLLVVVRPAGNPATAPTDGTAYSASTTFGSGATLGTGGRVVFAAANATTVTVTGLTESTAYAADIYTYNVGTVSGFENYGANSSTTSFTTPVQPPSAPGVLVLEEDFDYPTNTVLTSGTNGNWVRVGGVSTNLVDVDAASLAFDKYGSPARIGGAVTIVDGEDVGRAFSLPTTTPEYFISTLVNVASTTSGGDYFFGLNTTATNTGYAVRMYAKSSSGGVQFGIGYSTNAAVYAPTVYDLNTTYTLVIRYIKNSGTLDDMLELYVVAPSQASTGGISLIRPNTPSVSALGYSTSESTPGAVAIRQNVTSQAIVIDGIRVGTGWGSVVGRPVYSAAAATINAGNYYDITLSNSDVLTANGAVNVENNLTLTSGAFTTTGTNLLTLAAAATVSPMVPATGATVGYVNGPVARLVPAGTANAQFVFPVGRASNGVGKYRPITLNIAAQTNAVTYTAIQTEGNAGQNLSANNGQGTAPLQRVSYKRFYTVTPNVAPTDFSGTVTLSFGAEDYVNTPADPGLVVAKRDAAATDPLDNNKWTNLGHSAESGTASGPGGASVVGTITSAAFTGFSDFALGATNDLTNVNGINAVNPLPVQLSSFGAQRQAAQGVAVKWTTASEKNAAYFDVQRSLNTRDFVTVTTTQAQGTSSRASAYALLDKTAPAAALYYRLRQVDLDGTVAFSPVVSVAGSGEVAKVLLYPNPTSGDLHFIAAAATPYRVLNQLGQPLLQGTTEAGTATVELNTLPAGLYFLELQTAAGRNVQKFEKQ
jgi:hypothetical protein